MEWLNYHHLLYFWAVAREGGLAPAGRVLRLSHATLSAQIHALEDSLGAKLFQRQGRRLALTDTGRTVYRYADEIFALGRELVDVVKGRPTGRPARLNVGVADVLPKLVVKRVLDAALALHEPVHLLCHEDSHERLLARMSLHELDIVIADAPVPPGSRVRAFSHLLGESGITFYGARKFARLRKQFPRSLDGAAMLLPSESTALRRSLERWFDTVGVRPRVVAEFDDMALMGVFGTDGLGLFAGSTVVEAETARQYGVSVIGRTDAVVERFYALSAERRLQNPAVVAICEAARAELFG